MRRIFQIFFELFSFLCREEHSRRGECPFIQLKKPESEMTVMDLHELITKRLQFQLVGGVHMLRDLFLYCKHAVRYVPVLSTCCETRPCTVNML